MRTLRPKRDKRLAQDKLVIEAHLEGRLPDALSVPDSRLPLTGPFSKMLP